MTKKFAVILSGCGFLDGSEIHESVLTLLAIAKNNATYQCFAPNQLQHHVVNHQTNCETQEKRNILDEAARIARGDVKALEELKVTEFDALILPGGFGVAKNLFSFAIDGTDAKLSPNIEKIIMDFYKAEKFIGAICIAPALIARILQKNNIQANLTTGTLENCKNTLEIFNSDYEVSDSDTIIIDKNNKIISTAAYMNDTNIYDVSIGIEKLVNFIVSA